MSARDPSQHQAVTSSSPRQDSKSVRPHAACSALLLASVEAYGAPPGEVYGKWRQSQVQPSCLDLMTLLRQQLRQRPAAA